MSIGQENAVRKRDDRGVFRVDLRARVPRSMVPKVPLGPS
jgi:hypothetical protein